MNASLVSKLLIAYGAFLMAVGLLGYLSNPERAQTALISGGTFGSISITLGVLAARGSLLVGWLAMGISTMLSFVFAIRSAISWRAFFSQGEKFFAAILITSMLIATCLVITLLLRELLKPRRTGPAQS